MIAKLDLLARSTRDLSSIMSRFENMMVKLVVLDQQIDTSSTGMLLFTMLVAIETFEDDLRTKILF